MIHGGILGSLFLAPENFGLPLPRLEAMSNWAFLYVKSTATGHSPPTHLGAIFRVCAHPAPCGRCGLVSGHGPCLLAGNEGVLALLMPCRLRHAVAAGAAMFSDKVGQVLRRNSREVAKLRETIPTLQLPHLLWCRRFVDSDMC